jgi:hypothetical protein
MRSGIDRCCHARVSSKRHGAPIHRPCSTGSNSSRSGRRPSSQSAVRLLAKSGFHKPCNFRPRPAMRALFTHEYAAIQTGRRDGYTGLEFVAMDCTYSPPMRPKDRRGMSTDRELYASAWSLPTRCDERRRDLLDALPDLSLVEHGECQQ